MEDLNKMTAFWNRTLKISTVLMVGASIAAAVVPNVFLNRAIAQSVTFNDVPSDFWARPFIEKLAEDEIIAGFPDGSFKPKQAVTRAQFAAIVRKAFSRSAAVRNSRTFSDVAPKYWAAASIEKAYTTGFVSGYPDGTFLPEQQIPKAQAIIALASGLKLDPPSNVASALSVYRDASEIPDYAKNGVAAATQKTLVVNYPNVAFLNPTDIATRADVAAFVYQAMVNQNKMTALSSKSDAVAYIVNYDGKSTSSGSSSSNPSPSASPSPTSNNQNNRLIARGTVLPIRFSGGSNVKLILTPADTIQTNFEVAKTIVTSGGQTLIPEGSQVQGRFQPVSINGTTQGTQYFADKITINGTAYTINATSDPLLPTAPQAVSTGSLQGGLATTAAQVLLGSVLGSKADLGSILGGVLGSANAPAPASQPSNVIVVEPSKLVIKMQSDAQVAGRLGQPSTVARQIDLSSQR
jgi:S-layer homology domain